MFRPPVPVTPLLVSCLLACFGAAGCTNSSCIPSWALLIKVSGDDGAAAADSVMVSFDGGEPYVCPADDGQLGTYTCAGNQAGTYAVTVALGGVSETQNAQLDADICGVSDPMQLDFSFNAVPNTDEDAGAN